MSGSRLAAAALVVASAFFGLAPPAAAGTPTGAWTDPAPHATEEGVPVAYLERVAPLAGYAEFEGGIAGVAFTLVHDAAEPGEPCSAAETVPPQAAPGSDRRVDFAFEASFPCNRRYQVRATAAPRQRALQPEEDTPLRLNLWVDVAIPPPPTRAVQAEVVDRTVVVRWERAADAAPDFEGYQVRRSDGKGEFETIAETGPGAESFVDDTLPDAGGTFRYRVRGMRPGPEGGTTVFGVAGESEAAELAPVEPDEADDPGAGGSGDDDAGSSGSGGRRPTAATTVRRTYRPPAPTPARSRTVTTVDTGYDEALPFPEGREPVERVVEPPGDPAVVLRLDDETDGDRRQTMLLVAGGTTAASWAMLLRLISRKAALL